MNKYELTIDEKMALRENVERGVDYFDSAYPGWKTWIDYKTLNMRDGNNCICAQIFRHEFPGVTVYWRAIANEVAAIYPDGFDDPWKIYDKYGLAASFTGNYEESYEYLTFLWLEMIDAPLEPIA